ncbi:hypothetical protein TNCV_3538971 [Trichonephila clavipes]|nr:hypothetical protein TNCV_3538971 [Trichonephila clavipes]
MFNQYVEKSKGKEANIPFNFPRIKQKKKKKEKILGNFKCAFFTTGTDALGFALVTLFEVAGYPRNGGVFLKYRIIGQLSDKGNNKSSRRTRTNADSYAPKKPVIVFYFQPLPKATQYEKEKEQKNEIKHSYKHIHQKMLEQRKKQDEKQKTP